MARLTVLDASVLIAYFDPRDPHHADAVAIVRSADELAACTATLAETMVGPASVGRMAELNGKLKALGVQDIPIPAGAAPHIALLRAETGLKLPDAIVLWAALHSYASAVATHDQKLRAAAADFGFDTP